VKERVLCFQFRRVSGGKGLVDEYLPSSLYLTMLVIIYWASDFSQRHLQGSGSQVERGSSLGLVGYLQWNEGCRVRTGGLGVDLGSIEPREVRGI
jgi:hypothetical protein